MAGSLGPTSLGEKARLTGEYADWHNIVPRAVWVSGALDVAALRDAWRGVCLRHDVLRRTFVSADEACTYDEAPANFEVHSANTEADAIEIVERALGVPFTLIGSSFSRLVLVQCGEDRHLLGLAVDHVISDVISAALLEQTFADFYAKRLAGRAIDTTVTRTYDDFATRQRRAFSADWGEQSRTYWQQHVEGFGSYPPLFAAAAPKAEQWVPKLLRRDLPADTEARVHAFALRSRTTPFTVITSSVLTGVLEATDESVAGITINHHGRMLPGTAATMGLFVQTVPIQLRAASRTPVETVQEVFSRSLDVFENFVPLRVAGEAWGLDLVSPGREAGIYLSLNETAPSKPVPNLVKGATSADADIRIPGGKQWTDTVVIEWNLDPTDPHLVARYNNAVVSEAAVETLLASAEKFALSGTH